LRERVKRDKMKGCQSDIRIGEKRDRMKGDRKIDGM
jgi:hypothetical protein